MTTATNRPLIGSLFTGYGGLDDAVEKITGGEVVFVSDIDPGPVAYLRTRHPDVPNIGDMTVVDWSEHADVDVLTGGYPCQPFSAAGRRRGKNDERHLWPFVLEALKVIRPREAFFENVRGHLNLGFDDVLTDLTGNGYNVKWSIVAAGSVGAPHRRERLYIYAYADDAAVPVDLSDLPVTPRGGAKIPPAGSTVDGRVVPAQRVDAGVAFADALLPTPKASDSYMGRPRTSGRPIEKSTFLPTIVTVLPGTSTPSMLPTITANDADRERNNPAQLRRKSPPLSAVSAHFPPAMLPTVLARDAKGRSAPNREGGSSLPDVAVEFGEAGTDAGTWLAFNSAAWGKYAQAIARWSLITRPAPPPVEPNTKGNPRLTARFAEWLMGLDDGRLTDPDVGLTRTQVLKLAGNGVVPQAAHFAFTALTNLKET